MICFRSLSCNQDDDDDDDSDCDGIVVILIMMASMCFGLPTMNHDFNISVVSIGLDNYPALF